MYSVYCLIDPRTSKARYVGYTSSLKQRVEQHARGDSSNRDKDAWTQELQALGLTLIIQELEQVETEEQAREHEKAWIQHFLRQGLMLLNKQSLPQQIDRPKMGYGIRADLQRACKVIAAESGRYAYEIVEEALEQYIAEYQRCKQLEI